MLDRDLGLGAGAQALLADGDGPPTHAPYPLRGPARILIPTTSAPAAAAAIRSYTTPDSPATRLALATTASLARLGVARLAPGRIALGGAGTFLEHLGTVFDEPLLFGVHLGPPRANRKPVIHVMTPTGHSLAYVKIGVDAFTCSRVRREARALAALGHVPTPGLAAPALLSEGEWHGWAYLVMSPLLPGRSRIPGSDARARATDGLVGAFPTSTTELAEAPWWRETMTKLAERIHTPLGARLANAAHLVRERFGDVKLKIGAGHGDWSRWNMRASGAAVLAWDWERFHPGVPLGWDDLHFRLGGTPGGPERAFARGAPWLKEVPAAVLATYLLYRATTRMADQDASGVANPALLGWVLPAIENVLADPVGGEL